MKIWVLTFELNEYDQYGEYFISAWTRKPTADDIAELLPLESANTIQHVLNGGGRQDLEVQWYHLSEIDQGYNYNPKRYI